MKWWELAECQYIGTEIFYAERQGCKMEAGRKICAGCPVKSECLEAALVEERGTDYNHRFGLRGGLSPRERWQLAKERGEKFIDIEDIQPVYIDSAYFDTYLEVA